MGLQPCPHCGTAMHQHQHCFSHPHPAKGDCILRHYSFGNEKRADWNRRVPENATHSTNPGNSDHG